MLPQIKSAKKEAVIVNIYPEIDFKLQFDGCSKGNPGLAGSGAVIYHAGDEIWCKSQMVGENATNNYAEYMGLIIGLEKAVDMKSKKLFVEGDSMLVIKQMKGEYKVNSSNLIELYKEAKNLEKNFDVICYNHIYRNHNKRADELSNIALQM